MLTEKKKEFIEFMMESDVLRFGKERKKHTLFRKHR